MKYQLKVSPQGTEIQIGDSENVLSALKSAGYFIKSNCGGCASCGTCVIKVIEGENNLSEVTKEEERLLGNVFHLTKERLSCQLKIFGDVTVDISAHDEKKSQNKIKKREARKVLLRKGHEIAEQKPEEMTGRKREGGLKRPKAFNYSDDEN